MVEVLKQKEYVIASRSFRVGNDYVEQRSVGLVSEIIRDELKIYFVGISKIVFVKEKNIERFDIDKTGKPYDLKICNICHKLKNMYKEFEKNQNDKQGIATVRPSCRDCRARINGTNLISSERKRMESIRPKKGDIFTCPICEKQTIVGITANLVKDHNHKTGKGRAWICDSCNTGLGRFKDDVKFLKKVILYLQKYDHD